MKFIVAAFTFALIILVECDSITADDSSEEANEGPSYFPGFPRKCRKDEDCRKDECCQGLLVFGGTCNKRAREGDWCIPETGYGMFVHRCPCRDGLECSAGRWRKNRYPGIFGRPRCVRPPTTVTDGITTVTNEIVEVTDEVTNEVTGEVTNDVTDEVTNEVTDEVTNEVTEITEETTTDNSDEVTSEDDNLVTNDFTEETPEFDTVSSESED